MYLMQKVRRTASVHIGGSRYLLVRGCFTEAEVHKRSWRTLKLLIFHIFSVSGRYRHFSQCVCVCVWGGGTTALACRSTYKYLLQKISLSYICINVCIYKVEFALEQA
jgi:hypothetical protein